MYITDQPRRTYRKTRTRAEKRAIIDQHPKCVYCGDDEYEFLVLEHIEPLNRGGIDDISNITVSCGRCNSHKWDFTIDAFLAKLLQKRDWLSNEIASRQHDLYQLRRGFPRHYMHTETSLINKIETAAELQTYFKKIISAIVNNEYKIF